MSEDQTITGSTVISFSDQMRAIFWSAPRRWRISGILLIIAAGMYLLALALPSNADSDAISIFTFAPIFFVLILFVFWLFRLRFSHSRFSAEQKNVTYEINSEHVLIRDATGAVAVIPWSIVRRVEESRYGFAVAAKPYGLRWLPKRAFAAESVASLRRLFRQKLGDKDVRLLDPRNDTHDRGSQR